MNNKLEITGICSHVGDIQTFSGGFSKRTFALKEENPTKYPTEIALILKKDKTGLVNEATLGHKVTVTAFAESRRYDGAKGLQFFTDLTAVKVVDETLANDTAGGQLAPQPTPEPEPDQTEFDDMPF